MKVSIITVVYNGAKTIEQTILSVLEQTYKNIEYIIIDGQSTDGTQQIVEKYIGSIDCFVSGKDNGIYDAMNKGIQKATGEIIGIINSDDWYERDAVEKAVNFFEHTKADLVYGKIFLVYPDGEFKLVKKAPLETIWYQMAVPHPSVFVKREIYEKIGLFNLKYEISSDYELLLRFYSKHVKFGYIDTAIAYFRVGGLSTIRQKKGFEEHKEISLHYIEGSHDKNKLLADFQNWCTWTQFDMAIKSERKGLSDLLCEYFHEHICKIVIFGTGVWGEKCYRILKHKPIEVTAFADNDPSKWEQIFFEKKIINPQTLRYGKACVLVAVKYDGMRIKRKLNDLNNHQLSIVCLEELKDFVCNKK